MSSPLGRKIRQTRRMLGLSAVELGARCGIDWSSLLRWERAEERVPQHHLAALSRELCLSPQELDELRLWPDTRMKLPRGALRRSPVLPPYDCKGSLRQADELGSGASRIVAAAIRGLTPAQQAELEEAFPRDSSLELFTICHMLARGFSMSWLSPLDTGCPLFVLHPDKPRVKKQYAGHAMRHALVHAGQGEVLIAFPQVWLACPRSDDVFRLDLLMLFRVKRKEVWIDFEVDGLQHRDTPYYDMRRTDAIGLPRMGVTRPQVLSPNFVDQLLFAARSILQRI